MFKKVIAIITSVIILLTPIQASAVTWGEIVTGLQASDTFTSGETAAARTSEGEYVISGGQIDELVEVSTLQFSDSLKVLFQNIKIKQLNAHPGQRFGGYGWSQRERAWERYESEPD